MTTNGTEERPLPDGWEWTKIGELTEVIRGASPRPKGDPRYFGGNIPWVKISDVTRTPGKFIYETKDSVTQAGADKSRFLKNGTLILSNSGTVCVPKIMGVDGCIHDGFVAFPKLPDSINQTYFYHFFDSIRPRIIQENRQGITQVNLNTGIVRDIDLPLAPLPEQDRIVAEIEKQFTRLDQAVASLKRLQSNLARYKASVLKAACEGRLVPQDANDEPAADLLARILAERRAQWEKQEWQNLIVKAQKKAAQAQRKAQGLPARIKDLQPGEWEAIPEAEYARYLPKNDKWKEKYKEPAGVETAVLPDLPGGWVWTSLAQFIVKIEAGKSPKTQNKPVKSNEIGVIKVSAMSWGEFLPEENKALIDNFKPKNMPSIKSGDLLISRANTVELVGAVVLVKNDYPNLLLSDKSLRLVPSSDLIDKSYLLYALRAPWVRQLFENRATGTSDSMRNLSQGKILSAPISLPPLAEQERIVAEVERRLSVVSATEQAITTNLARAERLRQSILGRAFTGQLVPQNVSSGFGAA